MTFTPGFFKSNKEIKHIYTGVLARTLPKAEWTHAAHFAAAAAMIQDEDYVPVRDMPDIIRSYNLATGVRNTDSDGYHHTITLASLRAAEHVMNKAPEGTPLFQRVNHILASEFGSSNWPLTYWRKTVLFSVQARRNWTPPDIKPLPF